MSHPPLFPTIPLERVVIDNLHLFLRVCDVLINRFIIELKRQDSITSVKLFKSFDPDCYRHLSGFESFVTSLGVPGFNFYVGQSSKQLKCRTLIGPEKLKLCKHIRISSLVPNLDEEEADRIQFHWDELFHLNSTFSKKSAELTSADIDSFEERTRT